MARSQQKHLKRLNAPKHWMLDKMGGIWAPRPSSGPHKLRECLPLILMIRNRLKYALTGHEVKMICMQRLIKVDGKIRTEPTFPAGFMDVVTIELSNDRFRLLYDTKGRFVLHRIDEQETKFKLCRVMKKQTAQNKVPFIVTHDGRTIRYPDPAINVNDTIKLNLETGKIEQVVKFENGNLVMITKGRNTGRIGTIVRRDRHFGSFDIVLIRDAAGHEFATRLGNVFVIGEGEKALVSLPYGKGIKLSILEEKAARTHKN
ncbi:hypothetical protein WA158_003163 [Blastocystis sp. Blastoise]